MFVLLVVSTHLKNISQNGNLPQVGMNIKNVSNHHLVVCVEKTKAPLFLAPISQSSPVHLPHFYQLHDSPGEEESMRRIGGEETFKLSIHPGRLTWNLQITHLERKMIFQTSMIMFHVNLPWRTCLCQDLLRKLVI